MQAAVAQSAAVAPVHMIKLTATQGITPQPEPVSRDQLPKPPVNEFFFIELGVGERL
jgi:hypothetical protein